MTRSTRLRSRQQQQQYQTTTAAGSSSPSSSTDKENANRHSSNKSSTTRKSTPPLDNKSYKHSSLLHSTSASPSLRLQTIDSIQQQQANRQHFVTQLNISTRQRQALTDIDVNQTQPRHIISSIQLPPSPIKKRLKSSAQLSRTESPLLVEADQQRHERESVDEGEARNNWERRVNDEDTEYKHDLPSDNERITETQKLQTSTAVHSSPEQSTLDLLEPEFVPKQYRRRKRQRRVMQTAPEGSDMESVVSGCSRATDRSKQSQRSQLKYGKSQRVKPFTSSSRSQASLTSRIKLPTSTLHSTAAQQLRGRRRLDRLEQVRSALEQEIEFFAELDATPLEEICEVQELG